MALIVFHIILYHQLSVVGSGLNTAPLTQEQRILKSESHILYTCLCFWAKHPAHICSSCTTVRTAVKSGVRSEDRIPMRTISVLNPPVCVTQLWIRPTQYSTVRMAREVKGRTGPEKMISSKWINTNQNKCTNGSRLIPNYNLITVNTLHGLN